MIAERVAIEAARAADDKKAFDVRIMDMRLTLGITDYFVITSGNSERQVRRIKEAVQDRLKKEGFRPARREGEGFDRWIILDYVDVVVHIFMAEEREFYNLERLWQDAPLVEWSNTGST